jgi:hypothetical protein
MIMDTTTDSLDWHEALDSYSYPVDLRKFLGRDRFPGWFDQNFRKGDRSETVRFETRFGECAASHLEPWYEVVFWKMYNLGMARDSRTEGTIKRIESKRTLASTLWDRCTEYVQSETKKSFSQFQDVLIKGDSVAVAFTFPAFICPSRFPMVDTRIARYVASEASQLEFSATPKIDETLKRYRAGRRGVFLTLSDWEFIEEWVGWCRKMADRLSAQKKRVWRARDVEMAMFRAWGEPRERRTWPKAVPRYKLIDKLAQGQKASSSLNTQT